MLQQFYSLIFIIHDGIRHKITDHWIMFYIFLQFFDTRKNICNLVPHLSD